MYKQNGQLHFSPSDLTRYMESPFASWMDRLAIEHPERAPERDSANTLMATLAQKGFAHEADLEQEFADMGRSLIKIDGDSRHDSQQKTLEAMRAGVDVISQARLDLNAFGGYSDFLVKVTEGPDGSSKFGHYYYEIWDTKLASTVKPAFLIQLCCYAEMLEAIQGRLPETITVALGNGEKARFKTRHFTYYYQALKSEFLSVHNAWSAEQHPDPADSPNWGEWTNYAAQMLVERDHLFQVATITKSQIKKLNHAGINTMQTLASTPRARVSGINPSVLERLKAQAAIQLQTKARQASITATLPPCFKILKPKEGERTGLALLPPHSKNDVFFDIEGYPLDEGGLEYLWGNTYFDAEGNRQFKDFWAHSRTQEKQCFQDFIQWVYQRWQKDPEMHIYHYAHYEIAACRKLMGRYGVCEYEVDQLLRHEVFVDLYKIVKAGILLGEPRYSIKNVEHLYRGKRDTKVGSGGDSVVVYEQWRDLHARGEEGDTWNTSKILNDIRDYNIDDCNSTQELVQWLREQQSEHGIQYIGQPEVVEPEQKEEITERTQLRDRLLRRAIEEHESDPLQAALTENMAWVLEFHRREAKPVFWRLFERLGLSHIELLDDLDCLACCERTSREPFKPTPRARHLAYEYQFDPTQEFKGAAKQFYLLGIETEEGKQAKVTWIKEESDLENGFIVLQSKEPPPDVVSLIPDEYVNPNPIPQAIDQRVGDYENGSLLSTPTAIIDFLTRSKPRFKSDFLFPQGTNSIAPSHDPTERLQQIISAIKNLDNSYLTIQGPPGAGKSYTGKHVIAALVKAGARIGIASNSHKAINNLLLSTAKYIFALQQNGQSIQASFVCTSNTDPELTEYGISVLKNSDLVGHVEPGCVIGTTAWGFARDDMTAQLDYLFIDEAGQVAVANLIAMSRVANNLILMGDQMQLGQPSQGTHPAESGLSVLDYLLHETPTIPDDMGVFLGTTYRMHSRVNQFISDHIYDGRLESHPSNDERIIEVPSDYRMDTPSGLLNSYPLDSYPLDSYPLNKEAGIIYVPVRHEGNTQAAEEEVEVILSLAKQFIGRTFHTGRKTKPTRPIEWDDMLFVAPYNHQVSKLKLALGDHAKVGSVDKFQGQEAPIVFLSMCASDPAESPRGLDFLFDRHRLNVAISRAQTLAIVVANPAIGRATTSKVEQLTLVNVFNALTMQ